MLDLDLNNRAATSCLIFRLNQRDGRTRHVDLIAAGEIRILVLTLDIRVCRDSDLCFRRCRFRRRACTSAVTVNTLVD